MHVRRCCLSPCVSMWVAAAFLVLAAACSGGDPGVRIEPSSSGAAPSATSTGHTPAASATAGTTSMPDSVTIGFVGDLMFARDIITSMQEHGVAYPFERVRPLLTGFDLLIGNLEGTFTERGQPLVKMYTFRAPPPLISTLTTAGFSAVSLANNHAFDYRTEGLSDTLDALRGIGLPSFGAGLDEATARTPVILEAGGQRIAFLGYSGVDESGFADGAMPGVARGGAATIAADVAQARQRADHVVVFMHAGVEYTRQPTGWQETLAHAAIDAGADLVVGAHPHVLQPAERYGSGLILYSLGNFVFDLDSDDLATLGSAPFETAVAAVTLKRNGPPEVSFRPVYIDPLENRPRPATAAEAQRILEVLGTP